MTKEEVISKVKELAAAPTVCAELKKASEAYLAAAGTAKEKEASDALKKELKADVNSIDDVIPFFGSAEGEKILGKEQARKLYEAAKKAKAAGGKYCICPACQAGGALLDHESDF